MHQSSFQFSEIKIEVVTTAIADLAMMGFGSIGNCQSVCEALAERYPHAHLSIINSQSDLDALAARQPDLVVAGIKYLDFSASSAMKVSENKIWLSQYLTDLRINYTGSERAAILLDFDKWRAKDVMRQHGIPTAEAFTALPGQYADADKLPVRFPLFIKPLYESDSKGIDHKSVVKDFAEFNSKIGQIHHDFKQPALVEKFLSGREFTVAILAAGADAPLSVMPVELKLRSSKKPASFLGFKAKQDNFEQLEPVTDPKTFTQVSDLARKAFTVLGARDFGRIDIKMDAQGVPFFLEANLLPGMNPEYSYFPQACAICQGISYKQLVIRMAQAAFRH